MWNSSKFGLVVSALVENSATFAANISANAFGVGYGMRGQGFERGLKVTVGHQG